MAYKHGYARPGNVERLHNIWRGILKRCSNKKDMRYCARGITVCDAWRSDYLNFRVWALSSGYTEELTIDRVDNNAGYFPENCRWVSLARQANNRRNSKFITIDGTTQSLADWAREYQMPYGTVVARINVFKMSVMEALTTPLTAPRTYVWGGVTYTAAQLAAVTGLKLATLTYRLRHYPLEVALSGDPKRWKAGRIEVA